MNFPIQSSELLSHYFYDEEEYEDEFLCEREENSDDLIIDRIPEGDDDDEFLEHEENDARKMKLGWNKFKKHQLKERSDKRWIQPVAVQNQIIKTRFLELPPEILLNIIDFTIPFFSSLEQVLNGRVFDDESKRDTNTVLKNVILRMEKFISYTIHSQEQVSKMIPMFNSLTFTYFNSEAVTRKEDLLLRRGVELIVKEIFNFVLVSKNSFHKILITDCYNITTVKLFWDLLFHLL